MSAAESADGLGGRKAADQVPMLTQREVADQLHVTTKTVRNYVARGWLPAYRLGKSRATRYHRADVDALLKRVPVSDGAA